MVSKIKRVLLGTSLLAAFAVGSTGCATHAGTGAVIGGATGAGIGAIVGHNSHNHTAGGALIGGAIGALAGAAIGDAQDKAEAHAQASPPPPPVTEAPPPPPPYYGTRVREERITRYGPNGEVIVETRRYSY